MEPRPGIESSSAPTTRRIDGTMVRIRSTRSTRSARSTANGPLEGTSAMPTTAKSKILHGSRKKRSRWAMIRSRISITNTPRMILSIVSRISP
jgi:hypothetical protein